MNGLLVYWLSEHVISEEVLDLEIQRYVRHFGLGPMQSRRDL
jgi:hypothetical protein